MSSSLIVKAFLREEEVECRRFKLNQEEGRSVEKLKEKVTEAFRKLQHKTFKITYTDPEGDDVTITSDEELTVAVDEAMKRQDKLFKINVSLVQGRAKENKAKGPSCNSCQTDLQGVHFQCLQCPNYWLCQPCEKQGEHYHHSMMRLNQSLPTQEQIWEQFSPWISMWTSMMGCEGKTKQSSQSDEKADGPKKCTTDEGFSRNAPSFNLADIITQVLGGCGPKEQGATGGSDIACDGCKKEIKQANFKCLQCPNYHLCVECESNGMHQEHNMVRFPFPMPSQEDMMKHLQPWLSMWHNMTGQNSCGSDKEQKHEETTQQQENGSQQQEERSQQQEERSQPQQAHFPLFGFPGSCRDYARRPTPEEMLDQVLRAGTAAAEMFTAMGAGYRQSDDGSKLTIM